MRCFISLFCTINLENTISHNLFRLFAIMISCLLRKGIALLALWPVSVAAQTRLHWGAAGTVQFKGQLFSDGASKYGPWGGAGLYILNIIDGAEEGTLAFANKTGLILDHEQYKFMEMHRFNVQKMLFELNPEILFPLRSERARVAAGIGMNVLLETRLGLDNSYSSDMMDAFYYGNFENKERKIVPFITLGYLLKLQNIYLQFGLRQNLQRSYYNNESINLGDNISPIIIKLGHQPTFLSFSLWYMFN